MNVTVDSTDFDVELEDDGTMDTVVSITAPDWGDEESHELRYSCEFASEYRDDDGSLDFARFVDEVVIEDIACDLL